MECQKNGVVAKPNTSAQKKFKKSRWMSTYTHVPSRRIWIRAWHNNIVYFYVFKFKNAGIAWYSIYCYKFNYGTNNTSLLFITYMICFLFFFFWLQRNVTSTIFVIIENIKKYILIIIWAGLDWQPQGIVILTRFSPV